MTTIVQIIPAEGWKAVYEGREGSPLVCWALVEIRLPNPAGEPLREYTQKVQGMVACTNGKIQLAEDGVGFLRYCRV